MGRARVGSRIPVVKIRPAPHRPLPSEGAAPFSQKGGGAAPKDKKKTPSKKTLQKKPPGSGPGRNGPPAAGGPRQPRRQGAAPPRARAPPTAPSPTAPPTAPPPAPPRAPARRARAGGGAGGPWGSGGGGRERRARERGSVGGRVQHVLVQHVLVQHVLGEGDPREIGAEVFFGGSRYLEQAAREAGPELAVPRVLLPGLLGLGRWPVPPPPAPAPALPLSSNRPSRPRPSGFPPRPGGRQVAGEGLDDDVAGGHGADGGGRSPRRRLRSWS